MAVRRQLRELLLGRPLSGSVVVERPPLRDGDVAWILPPSLSTPSSSSTSSSTPSSSPPRPPLAGAGPASLLRRRGPLPECSAVFHCRGCWAVLSDSLKLCAQEDRDVRAVACCRATDEVIWKDSLMVGLEGALKGCAYYGLSCRSCGLAVGIILYSTPRRLAYLRGLFCFFKDCILCYFLKTQMVIEASLVKFPAVTIKDQVQEVKARVVMVHLRMELLMKKLEELQQKMVAERQQRLVSARGRQQAKRARLCPRVKISS